MDNSSQYFIALISAFLKENVPPKPIDINWKKVYKLSSIHCVSGAVYLAIQRLEKEDKPQLEILNKFKSDFFNTNLRYEEQEKVYKEIKGKLNEEHIEHIFFKGTEIREYYPAKEMRTLGDIDFLLHEKDEKLVNKILTEIGYENITTVDAFHWQYKKGNLIIEAHNKLMYNDINFKVDYVYYFQNAWENAVPKEKGYTYKLKLEYNLIFLITHIAKHFYDSGAGVRMILDIAVIINKFGDSLNFLYIWQELKKIKLDVFAENIFGLCYKWFQITVPNKESCNMQFWAVPTDLNVSSCNKKLSKTCNFEAASNKIVNMDDITYEILSKNILEGGIFGFNRKDRNDAVYLMGHKYGKINNRKLARGMALLGKVFLNFKDMKKLYPILTKLPFILPFAWILRGFMCIRIKRNRTLNIIKGFFKYSDEADKFYELMERVGLS